MQRILIFCFLVLGIPAGIYWAGGGFGGARPSMGRFVREIHALGGTRPPAESTDDAPDPGRRKPPTGKKPDRKPELPKPPVQPGEPETSRIQQAQKLFDGGRFADAARLFAGEDEQMHALSELGVAFATAFPVRIPDAPYYVVNDGQFEGFGTEQDGMLNLRSAGGRSLSFPKSSIRNRIRLDRDKALDRLARQITTEGLGRDLSGARLFALLQETFALGRPDVAAPLLPRALKIDEAEPFFLSSVRHRVPAAYQDGFYRAFARCQVLPEDGPLLQETVSAHAPRKLGDGKLKVRRKRNRSSIRNKKALALVRKAAPHRIEGTRLYKTVFLAGLDKASLADIEKAIVELEKAMEYYEEAFALEDNNEIHALVRYSSKLAFQLRFWREQVGG